MSETEIKVLDDAQQNFPVHTYSLLIKEQHLDTLGHMNNATYLMLYEEARWELITAGGYGLKEIQQLGVGPVILEIKISFLREVLLRETIMITTQSKAFKGKIGTLVQRMIKPDGKIASEAEFTFGTFDLKTRKLVAPPPQWLSLFSARLVKDVSAGRKDN